MIAQTLRRSIIVAALLLATACTSSPAPAGLDGAARADRGASADAARRPDASLPDSVDSVTPSPDVRGDLASADVDVDAVAADLSTVPKVKGAWAVGQGGVIVSNVGGSAWQPQTSGTSKTLYGVWGTASNDIWAVGLGGAVLRYDGATWRAQPSGVTDTLRAVWGSRHDDVWLAGTEWSGNKASALFLHWNGKTLSKVSSAGVVSKYQTGVSHLWGSAADDVWAMTSSALLMHWDGKRWTHDASWAIGGVAGGIWGAGRNDVWVSQSSRAYHWQGKQWTPTLVINEMGAIWGAAANDIWVSSKSGSLCHYDGSWDCHGAKVSRLIGSRWDAISGRAADDIYAVSASPKSAIAHYDGTLWTVTTTQHAYLHAIWVTP